MNGYDTFSRKDIFLSHFSGKDLDLYDYSYLFKKKMTGNKTNLIHRMMTRGMKEIPKE